MSKLETITIDTPSGSNTMQIGSTNTATINLGVSGDTINVPAGVTIANAGTATGFGEANTPIFSVRNDTSGTSVTDNTNTKVTWNIELKDSDNAIASDKFTVPSGKGGTYYLYSMVQGRGDGNDRLEVYYLNLYKNGSRIAMAENDFRANPSRKSTNTVSIITDLSASDYIEVYVAVDTNGGSSYLSGDDYQMLFGGYRIST